MNNIIIRLLQDKIEEYSNLARNYYERHQYYCWDKDIRRQLMIVLKTRSEYKRTLKEYEKLCHDAMVEKYKKISEEYKKHPDKYVEEMLGIKLYPYQKLMLKLFNKERNLR